MDELVELFLTKAKESLAEAGIQPTVRREHWGHDYVQAEFIGQLINRRKAYPTSLRASLERNFALRQTADYQRGRVNQTEAARALRRSDEFVQAVGDRAGE